MKKRSICLVLAMCFVLSGCRNNTQQTMPIETEKTTAMSGAVFMSTGFKEKATVVPQKAKTLDDMTFEIYVDYNGNGKGLMRYQQEIYEVATVNNDLYVRLLNGTYIRVNDLTGHLTPTVLDIQTADNLADIGFQMLNNVPTNFSFMNSELSVRSAYQKSDTIFESINVIDDNSCSVSELADVLNENKSTQTAIDEQPEKTEKPTRESFYNNSKLGVKIRGITYSVGDYCNIDTYFENSVPEGINPDYLRNGDKEVKVDYVSYISDDGHTKFKLVDGYVWCISTTSDFEFIGIHKGDSARELNAKLGFGLNRQEAEAFVPILPNLEAESARGGYVLHIGELTAKIEVNTREDSVSGIVVERPLSFA